MLAPVGAVDPRALSALYLSRIDPTPASAASLPVAAAGAAAASRSLSRIGFDAYVHAINQPLAPVTYDRLGRLDGLPEARPLVEINVGALGPRRFEAVYTPADVARAYGFDRTGLTGRGQTIAIPTAYHSPDLRSDLRVFDRAYNLPAVQLEVVNQNGGPAGGPTDPGWAVETALDVEWAHAVAPQATILVVEARSPSVADMTAAVDYARRRPDVSVISMSWGTAEFPEELRFDGLFTAPRGRRGLTFVAASGDYGAGTLWPSVSPNVLSVGGTSLAVTPTGHYGGEIAWAGSGGGVSVFEPQPAYQNGVQRTGRRTNPDVAYNAAPETGFSVYRGEWQSVGGTSAGAPQWAGLIAQANEARARRGYAPLEQAQRLVYSLPAHDFHDVVVGSNGYLAGVGYDLATGRGSPVADRVVRDLARPITPDAAVTPNLRFVFVGGLPYPVRGV